MRGGRLAGGESRMGRRVRKCACVVPAAATADRVWPMEESFSDVLVESLAGPLSGPLTEVLADPSAGSNVMVFLLVAGLGLGMALIYVPLRLFLTITARSRRLRLLQRIRRLREELGQPLIDP